MGWDGCRGRWNDGVAIKSADHCPAFEIQGQSQGLTGSLPPPPLRWAAAVPPTEDPESPSVTTCSRHLGFWTLFGRPLCTHVVVQGAFFPPSLPIFRSSLTFLGLRTHLKGKNTILEAFCSIIHRNFTKFGCAQVFEMNIVAKRSDLENIL